MSARPYTLLSEVEDRAMAYLRSRGRLTCSQLGELLWGSSRRSGSAPYARAAGKLLHRLERLELVERDRSDRHHFYWRAL